MAFTRRSVAGRSSSAGNPITQNITVQADDSVLILLMKISGGTNRAGGSPTYAGLTMTQANTVQKAAASPENNVEMWYLIEPPAGTLGVVIPNTGALTIARTFEAGVAQEGMSAALDIAGGANNTGLNPTLGALVTTGIGDIGFAVIGSGAQTWAPTAPTGTVITDTDDGTEGGSENYTLQAAAGSFTFSWTFGTSEDYAIVGAFFKEVAKPVYPNNYQFVTSQSAGIISTSGGIK
jgi:hypothetical protein